MLAELDRIYAPKYAPKLTRLLFWPIAPQRAHEIEVGLPSRPGYENG